MFKTQKTPFSIEWVFNSFIHREGTKQTKREKNQAGVCGKPLPIHIHNEQPDDTLPDHSMADTRKICFQALGRTAPPKNL